MANQYRVDQAYNVSSLQRKQNDPKVADLVALSKAINTIKETAETPLKIVRIPVEDLAVVGCADSSLYGNGTDLVEQDQDIARFDKHKLRSQAGAMVTFMDIHEMDSMGDVKYSVVDWRSRNSHRQHVSTFSAETSANLDAEGMVLFVRAIAADTLYGHKFTSILEHVVS